MSAPLSSPDVPHEPAWPTWMSAIGAALLHPRTIRALLGTGGGLVLAGGLVWLVSLGVFDDPRVLASSLIGGCCGVLFLGWGLAAKTRYRTAGLAAAGLACVALPMNLWLLHVQHLVEVTGGLWAWAAGCAALQAATVWLLRDRRFLLAVQGGVTLTALLALGQMHRLDEPLWIAGSLAALGLISVEGVRLFPRSSDDGANDDGANDDGGPEPSEYESPFARDPFALPLLWGGAALLTGAAGFAALAELARQNVVFLPRLPFEPAASRLIAAAVWTAVANGLVSLDRLAADVRRRRDERTGTTRDEGLFGLWSAVPALAAAAGSAAIWNVLEHLGLPDAWDPAVFAMCGVGLLALARRAGVGVVAVDRGQGAADEARGPGATALRCGAVTLAGAEIFALLRGAGALMNGPTWADAASLTAVAALGALGGSLQPVAWAKTLHHTLAGLVLGLAALAANALLQVPLARKFEAIAIALGAGMLAAAHAGRVREHVRDHGLDTDPSDPFVTDADRRQREEERGVVTIGLWFGTLFVLLPTAAAVFVMKSRQEPWALDALALVAASASLLIVGLSARTRAPALGGAIGLAGAAAVIVWSVAYRAEVTLGRGLTIGGATLFALGLVLSMLRDRLTARLSTLPRRWAEREGVFAVLDWR